MVIFLNIVLIVVVVGAVAIALIRQSEKKSQGEPSAVAALAQCLGEKGVKMYGATWCAHCQRQKKLFGDAADKIPYVECAVPGDPRLQSEACSAAGVTSYPTWEFASGERIQGEMTMEDLAVKSGCPWGAVEDTNPIDIQPSASAVTVPVAP